MPGMDKRPDVFLRFEVGARILGVAGSTTRWKLTGIFPGGVYIYQQIY